MDKIIVALYIGGPVLIISGFALWITDIPEAGIPLFVIGLILVVIMFTLLKLTTSDKNPFELRKQRAISIYNKCREKSVSDIDTAENKKALYIIAANYGIKDETKAEKYFLLGKDIFIKEERKNRKKEIERYKSDDKRLFDGQYALTKIVGKSKYYGTDQNVAALLKDKLLDDTEPQEKFKLLEFSDYYYELTPANNIKFICTVRVVGTPSILGSPAILDGSVKVTVSDGNGNEVGCGYYSAGGFNCYTNDGFIKIDFSKIGFSAEPKRIECICIKKAEKEDGSGKTLENRYTFDIQPLRLWFIER